MTEATEERIYGWKLIAAALGVTRNTAAAWYGRDVDPLPVRTGHLGVYAFAGALRDWVQRQDMSLHVHDELQALREQLKELAGQRRAPLGNAERHVGKSRSDR